MTTGKCVTKFKCKFIFPISFLLHRRRRCSAWDFFVPFPYFLFFLIFFCQGNLWDIWRRRQHWCIQKRNLIKYQVRRAHIKMCHYICYFFLSTDTGNLKAIQHKKVSFLWINQFDVKANGFVSLTAEKMFTLFDIWLFDHDSGIPNAVQSAW